MGEPCMLRPLYLLLLSLCYRVPKVERWNEQRENRFAGQRGGTSRGRMELFPGLSSLFSCRRTASASFIIPSQQLDF
ncbi:hypothetical protein LIER_09200 [Lithospermum erythrorhizon]|uniref:Secreted protein n=1 Tax=Lithospermum erythrorhizon TaxID=34254 RepID=A0AAV3PEV2_LITER